MIDLRASARHVVWPVTAVVLTVATTLIVTAAWSAEAAPGASDATFVPTDGCRAFDFRPPPDRRGPRAGALTANEVATVQITGGAGDCVGPLTIPSAAVAVAMNVTIVDPTAQSNLRLFPSGLTDVPTVSNLNFSAGQAPFPNKVDVKLSSTGAIDIFNQNGQVFVIGDVVGYYVPTSLTELDDRVTALETAGANQSVLDRIAALEADNAALKAQVAALETKTAPISNTVIDGHPTVRFTGVNVQVVDGTSNSECDKSGFEDCTGRGNLIVGYNEDTFGGDEERSGSHNIVVGTNNDYTSHSGLVAGSLNTISGEFATVTGGERNTASGLSASVSGGSENTASGILSSVTGGNNNTAGAIIATVLGGIRNSAGSTATAAGGADVACFGVVVCGTGDNGPL